MGNPGHSEMDHLSIFEYIISEWCMPVIQEGMPSTNKI